MELPEELIAEIFGLKAAIQSLAIRVAVNSHDPDSIKGMHVAAHTCLARNRIVVPGLNEAAIRARAESTVDQIFGSLTLTLDNKDRE